MATFDVLLMKASLIHQGSKKAMKLVKKTSTELLFLYTAYYSTAFLWFTFTLSFHDDFEMHISEVRGAILNRDNNNKKRFRELQRTVLFCKFSNYLSFTNVVYLMFLFAYCASYEQGRVGHSSQPTIC